MAWQFNNQSPVFMQIVQKIRADILTGTWGADDQIPSVRQLAFEASVNPNTMQRALSELESEGLLVSRGTTGRFVTSDVRILDAARAKIKREALEKMLRELRTLDISNDEIIQFIKEETDE